MVLKLNDEGEGLFEYRISESGGTISLRCRLQIKRTVFAADEYDLLREFFNMVVAKQTEQIVFKKKKNIFSTTLITIFFTIFINIE